MRFLFAIFLALAVNNSSMAQIPDTVITYQWEAMPDSIPNDSIFSISLSKLKLDSVPAELSNYKNLRYLDLGKNKLTFLPDFIVDFKQLESLNLEKNRFEICPLVICQLTNLTHLILNRNFIERMPDCIEYASELRYIDFYDNPIRELPESFERLKKLEKADFSGIRFGPSFQRKWMGRMPNVEFIFEEPCECME